MKCKCGESMVLFCTMESIASYTVDENGIVDSIADVVENKEDRYMLRCLECGRFSKVKVVLDEMGNPISAIKL